jgi:uncharacterized protein YjdB
LYTDLPKKIIYTLVTLNKTNTTIPMGRSEVLTADVSPSNATNTIIAWSSSNTSVATMDSNGKITALSPGTSTITVTTDDGNKTAVCLVTVVVPVSSVTLDKTKTLSVGSTETLTATISPSNATNKAVTWEINNTGVATVDNAGNVTAVAPGEAIIYVTTADGGKMAACVVNVIIPVTGVTLNKSNITISSGGSETLTATVNPVNATNKNVKLEKQ